MFDVGFWEVALISIVALVIIGPERLPAAARTAGLWLGRARRALREVKNDINRELQAQELADLNEIKRDLQDAGDDLAQSVNKTAKESGVGDAADDMRAAFAQAAPTRDDGNDSDDEVNKSDANQEEVTEEEKEEASQTETNKNAESKPA